MSGYACQQRHCYNQHQQQIQQQLQQQHQQPQLQQPQQQAYAQDGTAATMRPTDIEKIIEKKKGSQGPVPLFFRGKPKRRGKWLVVTGICIAALRRKPEIGSDRIESNRIESMPLVSRPALWFLLFLSLFCLFCPLFVFFWPKQSRVFFLPNFPKSAVVPFPQDEEEYAAAITKKFNWDILRDCDNGATLRTYLSRRLHCDP